jgi:WD40 repeat protein
LVASDARVVVGSMDGSVSMLDGRSGALLHSARPHRKYVVAAKWAPGGSSFVTGAWDEAVMVHECSGGVGWYQQDALGPIWHAE